MYNRVARVIPGLLLGVLVSGCYTAVRAPRTAAETTQPSVWKSEEKRPSVGRFSDEEDFYRYPGDVYGYGRAPYAGSPFVGYDSGTGLYGYGSYGYPGYTYGYGPYGYGADPYYYDSGGYYLPPGYELISTGELEDIRDTIRALNTRQPDPVREAREAELRRREEEERDQAFQTRLNPSRARAVEAAPYVPAPSSTVQKASGSKSSEAGKDIKSKSKRRRGR